MAPSFEDGDSLFNFVVRDGNGIKGMVDLGISKVPIQFIQPQHERIERLTTRSHELPPIDLSWLGGPNHDHVVEALVKASETFGFFQVVNHGVQIELLESVKDAAHRFFSQPPEKKAVYLKEVSPSPYVKYGTSFVPEREQALEWKDFLNMAYTSDEDALQHWPNECKEVALEFLKASTKIVRTITEVLLGNFGVTLDDSRFDALIGQRYVKMNLYPPCPNPDLALGLLGHSDKGILTVLLQDGIGGLYVKVEQDNVEGEWMEIPPVHGALVINVCDTLQILSNGRYKSAEHKVRTTSTQPRVSIPIFTLPRPTEKIGPLPEVVEKDGVAHYREFIFEDYMNNFFEKAREGKESLKFAEIGFS